MTGCLLYWIGCLLSVTSAILHVFRILLLLHFRVLDAICSETIEKDLVILIYWRSQRDHAFSTSLFSHCMIESVLSSLIDAIDRLIPIPFRWS